MSGEEVGLPADVSDDTVIVQSERRSSGPAFETINTGTTREDNCDAVFRLMFSLKLTSVCSCLNRSVRQVPNTKTFFENSPSNPQFRSMTIKTTPVDVTDVSDPKREKSTDNTHIERTSAQFRQRVNPGYLNWTHHAGVLPHSDRRSTSRHTLC